MSATREQTVELLKQLENVPKERIQELLDSGFLTDFCDAKITASGRPAFQRFLGSWPHSSFLEEIGTVTIPAVKECFCVLDKFVYCRAATFVPMYEKVVVPETRLGGQFKELFLDKTENPMAKSMLRCWELMMQSTNGQILRELGEKAETKLSQVYWLAQQQPNGQSGILRTDGRANLFFCRSEDGELRMVSMQWSYGWHMGGYRVVRSVRSPLRWNPGELVFSGA